MFPIQDMEASHSGQLHTLGKRESSDFVGSNPSASALSRKMNEGLLVFDQADHIMKILEVLMG